MLASKISLFTKKSFTSEQPPCYGYIVIRLRYISSDAFENSSESALEKLKCKEGKKESNNNNNNKVTLIIVAVDALGTITKGSVHGLEDMEIIGRVETIQTTVLLRSARILRRVLET